MNTRYSGVSGRQVRMHVNCRYIDLHYDVQWYMLSKNVILIHAADLCDLNIEHSAYSHLHNLWHAMV